MIDELSKEMKRFDPRLNAKKFDDKSVQIVFDDRPVARLIKDQYGIKLIFYSSFIFIDQQGMSALNGISRAVSRIINNDKWKTKVKFRHGSYHFARY